MSPRYKEESTGSFMVGSGRDIDEMRFQEIVIKTADFVTARPRNMEKCGAFSHIEGTELELLDHDFQFTIDRSNDPNCELYLQTTDRCNLKCPGCAVGLDKTSRKGAVLTSLSEIQRTIGETIAVFADAGKKHLKVKYAGGEPTLQVENINELSEFTKSEADAHDLSTDHVLITNGTLLTKDTVRKIGDMNMRINISLWGMGDTNDRERGNMGKPSFKKIFKGINYCKELGVPLSLTYIVTPTNAGELTPFINTFATDANTKISIALFRPQKPEQLKQIETSIEKMIDGIRDGIRAAEYIVTSGIATDAFRDFGYLRANGLNLFGCGAGESYFAIDSKGKRHSCHEAIGNEALQGKNIPQLGLITKDGGDLLDMWVMLHGGMCPQKNDGYRISESYPRKIYRSIAADLILLECERQERFGYE
jgi:sulfatase maturation enzyme AslB (radical SAM superfamily)